MSSDLIMLDVESETFAQGVQSQRAHQVAGTDLPAAVEKPLPESPQQSPPVTPEALTRADSNDVIQPSSQTSVADLNNEDLESSQKASETPDDHVQGSEPPASGDEISSGRHEEITEKYSSLWTDKEEQVHLSQSIRNCCTEHCVRLSPSHSITSKPFRASISVLKYFWHLMSGFR